MALEGRESSRVPDVLREIVADVVISGRLVFICEEFLHSDVNGWLR